MADKEKIGKLVEREISEEMKESYIDYAMSVIISRALPDVRDGLKPVQRRILYAMYEDGLRHNAKFKKSAQVIGSVLSRYHPHGDMAVYDALVRMAQDFTLRYPLIQGQGNFGSIDGDTAAAYRYCITGDSFVITNRCLERIGEISTKENINLKVLSFAGKINQSSKWFDSGIHPTIKVETFRGYSLRGTFNHPILILEQNFEGAPVFKWKLLSEIKPGDFAVIDRNNRALWPSKEPSLKEFYPKTKNRKFILHKLPTQMNPDLAFLMGAILAEGYISVNRKKKYGKVGFCNTNKEFIETFRSSFKKVFPDCPIYEKKRNPLGYGKKKFVSLEICSLYVAEFLKNLGLKIISSPKKQIPQIIFHSTKESVAAFLRGFVEGDGSILSYRKGQSPTIVFISKSKKLLQEVQIILLRFGIDSFLRFDGSKNNWVLLIRGRNNFELFQTIGFVSKKKRKRLEKYCKVNKDSQIMSKTDFIPFLASYLRKKYKNKEFKKWLLKHNIDRYPKLRKYYPILEKFLEKKDLELINFFLKQCYLFDRVILVKPDKKERVFSLRVDSKCHSFVSNGFISHNTEARLSKIGEEMLRDIEKETVDFTLNYDGTRKEPTVLPSPLPQLLLNGCVGIAVGMATNIPPHNLKEVCDALIYLIDHPKADTQDLFRFIQGPDFPTGGLVYNKKEMIESYSIGKGPILVRAKAEILENERGRPIILVSEIPYQVEKSQLLEQMAKLVTEKKIEGIKDIRDESDREGLRIVVELSKGAYPKKVLNALYKFTDLQKVFHLNVVALVEGILPRNLNLVEVLEHFLSHRREVVLRRSKFELEKAKEKGHILEGIKKCLGKIEEVVKIIKESKDRETAREKLMKRFSLDKVQAEAILETKLAALARLERERIENELKEIERKTKELSEILKNPKKVNEIIKKELVYLKENFGDERRTKIFEESLGEIAEEELIPEEETLITLTKGGYIKRSDPKEFRAQKRGGKGILGIKTVGEDFVEHFLLCNTHDNLLVFTDSGKVFKIPVYEIPKEERQSKGKGIFNFLEILPEDQILGLISIGREDEKKGLKYILFATKNGIIKKTPISEFKNVRRTGLMAISLKKGDILIECQKSSGEDEIILATKRGQLIRFKEKEVREMGRQAVGIRGIKLKKDDEVIGMEVIKKGVPKGNLLFLTENGFGKKTEIKEFKVQKRGGMGIKCSKISQKTGGLVEIKFLLDEMDLICISRKGKIFKTKISSIPKQKRPTQGVKIMKLEGGDKIASAICI